MTEKDAIARMKQGDIAGLELLVRKYQLKAVRTAYLITRDRPLAEDVVQAAFLRAYERIAQFDAGRPFGPWFLRSVVNAAIKASTRRERQVSLDNPIAEGGSVSLADLLADRTPQPADLAEAAEARRIVWEALGQLPPAQRAAIVLRYYLELSEAEMAREMGCPRGTVKWRLHMARKRLRALLRPFRALERASGWRR